MKNYILTERPNLFEPNDYINFLVEIEGSPSADELMSAVKAAFAANEATMSKVVLESEGSAFYEKLSESGCKVSVSGGDWREIVRENEKVPFAIEHGETVRVFVIQNGEKTALLLMSHHLAGDGKSVICFIEDIMKALSGQILDYKTMNLITKESFPKESELPFAVKLYANYINKKWNRAPKHFTWDDYYSVQSKYWSEHDSQIIIETFSQDETERIKTRAKSAGVSVNSFIAAAFLKENRNKGSLGIPVSVRSESDKSMSNQTSGLSVKYTYLDRKSFNENAKALHKEIQKKLQSPVMKYFVLQFLALISPSLVDSVLLYTHGLYSNKLVKKFAGIMGYVGKSKREIGITNLTAIDIPTQYAAYKIKNITFVPPAVSYARNIIGVSTVNGKMTITYHFMSDRDEYTQPDFFSRVIMNLRQCEGL